MTAEKYVKRITDKLPCDKKRKQDIAMQLLAEIEERRAQGETVETIMEEMGSAEEVAESFLETISTQDRQRYRQKKIVLLSAVVLLCVALLGVAGYWFLPRSAELEADGYFRRSEVEERLIKVILLLNQDDYDDLAELATPQMAPYLDQAYMDSVKSQVGGSSGSILSIGEIYAQQIRRMGQTFAVCQVNISYENTAVTYTITFDQDMRLAGLYMK